MKPYDDVVNIKVPEHIPTVGEILHWEGSMLVVKLKGGAAFTINEQDDLQTTYYSKLETNDQYGWTDQYIEKAIRSVHPDVASVILFNL